MNGHPDVVIDQSLPTPSGDAWFVTAENTTGSFKVVTIRILCLDV